MCLTCNRCLHTHYLHVYVDGHIRSDDARAVHQRAALRREAAMKSFRLRIEYVPMPLAADVDNGLASNRMDWPADAELKEASVRYFGDEPVVMLLWLEPV